MTEQQVLALIAGEMRRLATIIGAQLPSTITPLSVALRMAYPIPPAPPPAAESEEEVVERVAVAIWNAKGHERPWGMLSDFQRFNLRTEARAAIAAVKGGGGE